MCLVNGKYGIEVGYKIKWKKKDEKMQMMIFQPQFIVNPSNKYRYIL